MWRWLVVLSGLAYLFTVRAQHGAVLCRQPKDKGFTCVGVMPTSYYYFDYVLRDCIEFMFQGCGGNGNRFVTKQQCLHGCGPLRQCSQGEPLTDMAGVNYVRCSNVKPCPAGYECLQDEHRVHSTLCCPEAARICSLSVQSGNVCPGVSSTSQHFYDKSTNMCREFTYHGCGGNENRFKSKGACLKFCADTITCLVGEPLPDAAEASRVQKCVYDEHCPKNYTCTEPNGRASAACCPSKESICHEPVKPGTSCQLKLPSSRWYFDHKRALCRPFDFSGCNGNLNNFASVEQCQELCLGLCPAGSRPHINGYSGQVQLCSTISNHCPAGFECFSKSTEISICCQTPARCPKPESNTQYADNSDPGNPTPVKCIPEDQNQCRTGYQCVQAPNKEYICCSMPIECPLGMQLLRDYLDGRPRLCSPGVPGTCPQSYGCVKSRLGAERVCCRSEQLCLMPFMDPETLEPRVCTPNDAEHCPTNTRCLATPNTPKENQFFCCHHVKYYSCPDGSLPYMEPGALEPRSCTYGDRMSCPVDFDCERLDDGTLACCESSLRSRLCSMAYIDPKKGLIKCKDWTDKTCPRDTTCLRATDETFYCCIE